MYQTPTRNARDDSIRQLDPLTIPLQRRARRECTPRLLPNAALLLPQVQIRANVHLRLAKAGLLPAPHLKQQPRIKEYGLLDFEDAQKRRGTEILGVYRCLET